jgi:fatty acid kinase fatty acid binding subunit
VVEPRFSRDRPQGLSDISLAADRAVRQVAVVSDTTAYLPGEVVRQHDIRLVSLYVNWQDGSQRESQIGDYGHFYERLRTADQLPTTSQPSIGDFLEVFEPLVAQGLDVVSIHISGGISGTVESARQAAEQIGVGGSGRVTVIDSETGAGGLGLTVLAAARAAQAGAAAADVERAARDARASLKMWFAVDTLEYLRRGGRIGAASAWLGTALKIKPILTLDREITPIERVRTGARALKRLTEYAQQRNEDGADGWVVQHIQAEEEANRLIAEAEQIFECPPVFVSEVGPVIGAHVGPGLLGIGGVPSAVLEPLQAAHAAADTAPASS